MMPKYSHEQIHDFAPNSGEFNRRRRLSVKAAALIMAGLTVAGCAGRSSEKPPANTTTTATSTTTTMIRPPTSTTESTTTTTLPEGPAQTNPKFATYPTWAQTFAGEVNGKLNPRDWNVYVGPSLANKEAEYNTANTANLRVQNGMLTIEAKKQSTHGYDYTSARINTKGKETFLYGKLVFSAELPVGIGSWPAIWMESADNKYENNGPKNEINRYLNDGETDILEAVGIYDCKVFGIVHTLTSGGNANNSGHDGTITVPNCNTTFHDYGLEWTPDSMTFSVDNQPFFTYEKKPNAGYQTWPFDQPFYLIIDSAVGGVWGGMDRGIYPPSGVDNANLPSDFNIRSMYYYPLAN
jgi:beta-glucanase (GH16 family)